MAQPECANKKDSAAGNAQQIMPHEQISTQGALDNASLSTLHYVLCHDWEGQVSLEALYPPSIESHKCGKFVHVGETIWVWSIGSVAAVVYRGGHGIPGGKMMDWLLAWSNHPSSPNCAHINNKVYTQIAEPGTPWNWELTRKKLDEGQSSAKCEWNGYHATLTIGKGASANLEGTITFYPR